MLRQVDEQVRDLLLLHSGIKRAEIARILGVHRSRISRVIDRLSIFLPIAEDENRKLSIDKSRIISRVDLNIHEIVALFLSARLLTRELNIYNTHTATVLKKLSMCIEKYTPEIARQISASSSEILRLNDVSGNSKAVAVLERLAECWLNQKKALISHFSYKDGIIKEYIASVYSIEPYAQGKTIHILIHCDNEKFIRDLKLERIEKVKILTEDYQVPENFSNGSHFRDAWGIWLDDSGIVQEVRLKFSSAVAYRLKENVWHASQRLTENADGTVIAEFRISQPREMVPWIRGWGKDVEVLAPVKLRESLKSEIVEMGKVYKEK